MSQPLGTFVPRPSQTGDQFQARFAVGRPLFVQVVAVDGARQVKDQETGATVVKKSVTVNVWDLVGGQISVTDQGMPVQGAPNTVYCNVLWMAAAVVDNLEPYVGAPPMPLKIVSTKGKGKYFYLVLEGIEGPELQQMQQIFAADPTRIDREAAAKAQASAAQASAPAYQQSGFQPMQVQPSAPQYQQAPNGYQPQGGQYPQQPPAQQMPAAAQFQPAPQGYQQPPAAAQFQAPAGQPGALASIPAQVAQQYAPVDQAAQQAVAQQYAPVGPGMTPPQNNPPVQGQPQFQQAPAQPGIGHVQNSDVANILAGLAGQAPPQG